MEKMIAIINNNLATVVNGIKEHRDDTERTLQIIKHDMDEKIGLAGTYKQSVEVARKNIESLENEITDLENDLNELTAKFGGKDFKEILVAGNKEINSKIIEKRALINEESNQILELTKKAHDLKDELVKLKTRRTNIEEELSKTITLEKYYETRIGSVIDYANEHPTELSSFVEEEPTEELNVNENEYENIDINNIIDGAIFNEIDEISSDDTEVSEDLIKEVLENPEEDEDEEEIVDESEQEEVALDLTMTQQLDDVINEATSILKRNAELAKIQEEKIKTVQEELKVEEPIEELTEAPVLEEKELEPIENEVFESHFVDTEDSIEINVSDELEKNEIPEDAEIVSAFDLDSDPEPEELLVNLDELNAELEKLDEEDLESELEEVKEEQQNVEEEIESEVVEEMVIDTDGLQEVTPEFFEAMISDTKVPEENDNVYTNVINESVFNQDNSKDFYELVKDAGLDIDRFSPEDVISLQKTFNKDNTVEFIKIVKKHNLPISRIYDNVDVLINVTPQNLDQILTILEGTGASNEAVSTVFRYLNKVNVTDLEKNAKLGMELTKALSFAIPYIENKDLASILEISDKAIKDLKSKETMEDYKLFCLFPEIVLENYKTLKKYGVKSPEECISKHPHRFTFNTDVFASILDKYEPEDLVRCINKNSAVLDKL